MPVPIGRDLSIHIPASHLEVIVSDPPAGPPAIREVRFEVVDAGRLAEETWQELFAPPGRRVTSREVLQMLLRVEADLESNPPAPNLLEEIGTQGNYEPMTWTMPIQAFAESLRPLPPEEPSGFLGELNPYRFRAENLPKPVAPEPCGPDCLCQLCRAQLWREYQEWRHEMGLNSFGKRIIWEPHADTTAWDFSYRRLPPNNRGRGGDPRPDDMPESHFQPCYILTEWTDPDGRPLDPHARALWEAVF